MEHPIHKERLNVLELFSLKKKRFRENVTHVCKYAMGKIKKSETDTSQQYPLRGQRHEHESMNISKLYTVRVIQHCNSCPGCWWSPCPWTYSNLTGHSTEQPAVMDSA